MDQAHLYEKVRDILVEVLMLEPEAIRPGARVLVDLEAESIDLLDMRFRIEKAFGFRINEHDLARAFGQMTFDEYREAFTVGALCEYVQTRLGEMSG